MGPASVCQHEMTGHSPTFPAPTIVEVERIAALRDPVIRNLQITQCYHELSAALAQRTGQGANWCTFATWASKQAGQSIRKEDLRRTLERALQEPAAGQPAAIDAVAQAQAQGVRRSPAEILAAARRALDLRLAVERASEAVGRGNLKVFEEIGREFARFLAEFLDDDRPDEEKLRRFCATLRPGEPPDGQDYLRRAFERYYRAFFTTDVKSRAELLLGANIEIGFHEQTRLQPEIAEALDAGLVNTTRFTRRVIRSIIPFSGWITSSIWLGRKALGRATALEQAIQALHTAIQIQVRRIFTEALMTIRFPPDTLVRLGDDLQAGFPETLHRLNDPDLLTLLAQLDPTPDSPEQSGALDWAYLPDRLHFIADLFRCYQETPPLFEAPFTQEQTAAIKAGRIPEGDL